MRRTIVITIIAIIAMVSSVIIIDGSDGGSGRTLVQDDFTFILNSDNTAEIQSYSGTGGDIIIPSTIRYDGHDYAVTSIGYRAFILSNVTSVIIPDSVECIGYEAFHDNELKNVYIGKGLKDVGECAFSSIRGSYGNYPDAGFNVDPDNPYLKASSAPYTPGLLMSKDGTILYSALCSMGGHLSIPDTVKAISSDAFTFCTKFEDSIYIPASVEEIGHNAFWNVGGTDFRVDPDNAFFSDRDGYLMSGDGKLLISCPHDYPGDYVIPEGTEEICDFVFVSLARGLETIELPSSLRVIGDYTFASFFLERIVLNEGLEVIGEGAFSRSLSGAQGRLEIPASVSYIGLDAFNRLGITDLVIKGSPNIGYRAFANNPFETVTFLEPILGNLSTCFNDPLKPHHKLIGVFSDLAFSEPFSFFGGVSESDTTLYYQWEVNEYKVTFMDDDFVPESFWFRMGSVIDRIPLINARDGYGPGFWSLDGRTEYDFTTPRESDLTLFACYRSLTKETFVVTYMNGSDVFFIDTVGSGSTTSIRHVPLVDGMEFIRWSLDEDIGFDSSTPITHDITLHAVFMPEQPVYTVQFIVEGESPKSFKVKAGSTLTYYLEVPYRPGYEGFWSVDGVNKFDILKPILCDTVVHAVYLEDYPTSGCYKVYMKSTPYDAVDVLIISFDGLPVPRGDVTVTFHYTYYDDFAGDYMTAKKSETHSIGDTHETIVNRFVYEPQGYPTIYSASAVFTSNGVSNGSGAIFC